MKPIAFQRYRLLWQGGESTLCHLQLVFTRRVNSTLFMGCKQTNYCSPIFWRNINMAYVYFKPKSVFVRTYIRFRYGRLENVCQHYRSYPGQLALFS